MRCLACLTRPAVIETKDDDGSPPQVPISSSNTFYLPMTQDAFQDAEFKSITIRNFKKLLSLMHEEHGTEPKKINSHWLRGRLRNSEIAHGSDSHEIKVLKIKHPVKQYPELFSKEKPQVAVTYPWSLGLDEEIGLLSLIKGMDENLKIWLDVLFIDQQSTNIVMKLAKAQEVYRLTDHHWVLGTETLLSRGWCLFELCLRASHGKKSLILGSLGDTERLSEQNFFTGMQFYDAEDKKAIEKALKAMHGWQWDCETAVNKLVLKQIFAVDAKDSVNPEVHQKSANGKILNSEKQGLQIVASESSFKNLAQSKEKVRESKGLSAGLYPIQMSLTPDTKTSQLRPSTGLKTILRSPIKSVRKSSPARSPLVHASLVRANSASPSAEQLGEDQPKSQFNLSRSGNAWASRNIFRQSSGMEQSSVGSWSQYDVLRGRK